MQEDVAEAIAGQLRSEMARRKIKTARLAEALGKTESWVSRRLNGKTQITASDLVRMAGALGVPPESFLPAPAKAA